MNNKAKNLSVWYKSDEIYWSGKNDEVKHLIIRNSYTETAGTFCCKYAGLVGDNHLTLEMTLCLVCERKHKEYNMRIEEYKTKIK